MRKSFVALAGALAAVTLLAACTSPSSRTPPRCGDGHVDPGEACDDGNAVDTDACTSRCTLPTCGDGIVQGAEECDDGNAVNTDGCLDTCVTPTCGDGFVHLGVEECDPSVPGGDPGCRSDCTRYRCGDGEVRDGEECDDGNAAGGDGCSATCKVENGFCCIAGVGCVQTGAQPDAAPGATPARNVCLECRPGASKTAWTPVQGSCDDGLFCNGTDTCGAGACVHSGPPCANPTPTCDEARDGCFACGTAADCDDHNPCTDDACRGGSCTHTNNTAPCDDGLWCNGPDTCAGGMCDAHAGRTCADTTPHCSEELGACVACLVAAQCDDREVCTTDTCVAGACLHAPNTLPCDDGAFCNGADTCANGSCSVHPGNPCGATRPYCVETTRACVQCTTNAQCDDGNYCTGAEACVNGACVAGTSPCIGAKPYCVEATDTCVQCTTSAQCDDGNFCNGAETCSAAGACVAGTPPCGGTTPYCLEATDTCVQCTADSHCPQDTTYCNGVEYCANGACGHKDLPCAGTARPYCVEASKACVECVADSGCADGSTLTVDRCGAGGVCTHATCGRDASGSQTYDCNSYSGDDCESTDAACTNACLPDEAACSSDADCCGGYCCRGARICC